MLVSVGSYERVLYGIDVSQITADGTPKVAFAMAAHTGNIRCITSGGRFLATGSSDETVRIFDIKKRKDVGSLSQHQGTVTALAFSQCNEIETNPSHLLTAGEDGRIALFRTSDWECLHVLRHKDVVESLAFHPSNRIAISIGKTGSMRLWNLMTGKQAFSSKTMLKRGHQSPLFVSFVTDQHFAVLYDHSAVLYSVSSESPISVFDSSTRLSTMSQTTSADTNSEQILLWCAGDGPVVHCVNLSTGSIIQSFDTGLGERVRIKCLQFKENVLVASTSCGRIIGYQVVGNISIDVANPLWNHDSTLRITCMTTSL